MVRSAAFAFAAPADCIEFVNTDVRRQPPATAIRTSPTALRHQKLQHYTALLDWLPPILVVNDLTRKRWSRTMEGVGRHQTQTHSYGQIVLDRINDPRDRRTVREVGRNIGYSHEYVRKVTRGAQVGSREFSDALSAYLGLNAERMWELATLEKAQRHFGHDVATAAARHPGEPLLAIAAALDPPSRTRLTELAQRWSSLGPDDQQRILDMAKTWSATLASGRSEGHWSPQAKDAVVQDATAKNTLAKRRLKPQRS